MPFRAVEAFVQQIDICTTDANRCNASVRMSAHGKERFSQSPVIGTRRCQAEPCHHTVCIGRRQHAAALDPTTAVTIADVRVPTQPPITSTMSVAYRCCGCIDRLIDCLVAAEHCGQ